MLRYVDQWCCRACPEFRASNFSKAQHPEFFFFHIICRGEFWALFASLLQRLETSEDADRQLSCSCDRAWLGQRQKLSQRYQRESQTRLLMVINELNRDRYRIIRNMDSLCCRMPTTLICCSLCQHVTAT